MSATFSNTLSKATNGQMPAGRNTSLSTTSEAVSSNDSNQTEQTTTDDATRTISQFSETVLAVTNAIEKKLYKETNLTIDEYFREHWHMSRAQAYRLFACASLLREMSDLSITPSRERHCRIIKKCAPSPADRRRLWLELLRLTGNNESLMTSNMIVTTWQQLVDKAPPPPSSTPARSSNDEVYAVLNAAKSLQSYATPQSEMELMPTTMPTKFHETQTQEQKFMITPNPSPPNLIQRSAVINSAAPGYQYSRDYHQGNQFRSFMPLRQFGVPPPLQQSNPQHLAQSMQYQASADQQHFAQSPVQQEFASDITHRPRVHALKRESQTMSQYEIAPSSTPSPILTDKFPLSHIVPSSRILAHPYSRPTKDGMDSMMSSDALALQKLIAQGEARKNPATLAAPALVNDNQVSYRSQMREFGSVPSGLFNPNRALSNSTRSSSISALDSNNPCRRARQLSIASSNSSFGVTSSTTGGAGGSTQSSLASLVSNYQSSDRSSNDAAGQLTSMNLSNDAKENSGGYAGFVRRRSMGSSLDRIISNTLDTHTEESHSQILKQHSSIIRHGMIGDDMFDTQDLEKKDTVSQLEPRKAEVSLIGAQKINASSTDSLNWKIGFLLNDD